MAGDDVVEVYWATDARDAHLARVVLETAGIRAEVVGEAMSIMTLGELAPGTVLAPRVWVLRSDFDRARRLLAEWEQQRAAAGTGEDWTCPQCDAAVEASFEICWRCETPRDAPRGPEEQREDREGWGFTAAAE